MTCGLLLACLLVVPLPDGPDEPHWSLSPVSDPPLPEVVNGGWPLNAVDHFLLAGMEAAGLSPSVDAAASTLLRRLHFDLVGLPPSPEELEDFGREPSPERYAAEVERLLASPRFGERWGRHWLDVARFAESSGGGRSLMFPDAWRYRDYVVDAFNADLPFDRFLREQLAGDLLAASDPEERNRQRIATGFLLLGPTNYEQQDKELLRLDVIDEQIDTVGRAFLGQSLGCARCHEHKFDPVSSEDYYGLAGIFGSTEVLTPGNVSGWVTRELEGPETARWHEHRRALEEVEAEYAAMQEAARVATVVDMQSLPGLVLDDTDASVIGEWKLSTHTKGYLGAGYLHDQDRSKGTQSVTFTPDVVTEGVFELRLSYTPGSNRATNVPVVVECLDGRSEHTLNQRIPPTLPGGFASLGQLRFGSGMSGIVSVGTGGTDGHVIVDALQLIPVEELGEEVRGAGIEPALLAHLEGRIAALKSQEPPAPPRAMAAREGAEPMDEALRLGGGVRELGAVVPRATPGFCGLSPRTIPAGSSGRLALANWLADPAHPLTARVWANRVWLHLFGRGIVRTPDDFGTMGEEPTHPALLDHLARGVVEQGWSTKGLIRRLVHSRAYRQVSGAAPSADPDNRLWSVALCRRLDADALRDALLEVSGELDLTRGGPTIRELAQYDYGYEFDTLRRSVYVPRFRNSELDLFEVFDGANSNLVSGLRAQSQVSTQALFLMNSPWVRERASALARRVLRRSEDRSTRLRDAFRLALGRDPTSSESALIGAQLDRLSSDEEAAWSSVVHALCACLDFRYLS